jgi:glycosyltransferase involved in cell wall biosynthesis
MKKVPRPSSPQAPPLVSIVVPVYSRLRYLGATVESVLSQTLVAWELLVVDDGSQEDVQGFIAQYQDPRIAFFRQRNQGNSVARNVGISRSSGEYVVCLDSDDVWQPSMLEKCASFLAAHPNVHVVYTQVQLIDGDGYALSRAMGPEPYSGGLLEPLLMGYPILPSSAIARRFCYERWGAYTPGMDDWELWLRWAAEGCRFACIAQPLLGYRIHDQNYNLDYERRRATHFAMLDTFYAKGELPEAAKRLRDRAYANQHFRFAVLAWQVGRPEHGAAEFVAAVLRHPDYLADADFHTRIACAHQGRLDAGTERGLNLEAAETTLTQCLVALFSQPDLPRELAAKRGQAYGMAYLALARLAYGVARDMAQARRWLWHAVEWWPGLALHSDWVAWLARSNVGYARLQTVKRTLHGRTGDA